MGNIDYSSDYASYSLRNLGYSVSAEHVFETLMGTDYDTARLLLDQKPWSSRASRLDRFLSHPVKGRSLEQLKHDYSELTYLEDPKVRGSLQEAYLEGWSRHDAASALDWVAAHVSDEKRRKRIYGRILGTDTDKAMDLMLARHGEADYDTMMSAISGNQMMLSPQQVQKFLAHNQSIEHRRNLLIRTVDKGGWKVSGVNILPSSIPKSVLVIPRR